MLTTQAPRQVSTHGVAQTSAFSIKANGKAFKVLIDSIYSDKPRAVVRELWTNAFDAHVMADKGDVPFDCHLPTIFQPVFSVRDYGIGMDHDTIMTLYTTVFESSKEHTNTQVGKLGLGSKSPFAYTDTFTVTSYSGSSKTSYSAFIGADYIPQLAVMGSEPSTEPRGIEVSFPVKTGDVQAFQRAAELTILGFDVRPNLTGNKINVGEMTTVMSGNGWKLVSGAPWGTGAYARQGCVVYPIDRNAIPGLTSVQQSIVCSPVFIDFPIGELEIAASRETLGYDAPTIANIKTAIVRIEKEIVAGFQSEIDACTSMWRAAIRLKKICKGLDRTIADVVRSNITYRGKKIESSVSLYSMGLSALNEGKTFEQGGVRAMHIHQDTLQRGKHYGRKASLKWEPSYNANVMLGETTIVIEDIDKNTSMPSRRLRHWYDSNNIEGSILWLKGSGKSSGFARVLVKLGRPDNVVYLADMEKPPREASARGPRTAVKMKRLAEHQWVDTDVAEDDEVIYVHMERGNVLGPDATDKNKETRSNSSVHDAAKLLVKLGYMDKDDVVIGVPATHKKVPANNAETWTCFWDLVKRAVDEHYDAAEASKAEAYNAFYNRSGKVQALMRCLVEDPAFKGFANDGPANTLYEFWKEAHDEAKKTETIKDGLTLANILLSHNLPRSGVTVTVSDESIVKRFHKTYPLVDMNLQHWGAPERSVTNAIIKYVNFVDADRVSRINVTQNNDKAA